MQQDSFPYETLKTAIEGCMARDKHACLKQLTRLQQTYKKGSRDDDKLVELIDRIQQSVRKALTRQERMPAVLFPEALPVSMRKDEISDCIQQHQVVIVAGETGSGKTTQLPKICMTLGRGTQGMIGHTQPRRIAASTVASRIAEELNSPLGELVGYQVRFQDTCSPDAYIKLMTDGILLAEVQHDPYLTKYDTLIIDEAHERSLNIDFLLGYLKNILPKRPDLKVIITSATIDVERFSKHFDDAPIVEVSGRTYPVDIHYRPWQGELDDSAQAVVEAIEDIQTQYAGHRGDILVFLSGERDIREAAKAIKNAGFKHLNILPLYARLSLAEQAKIFQPHAGRRVVLATNVAETSLTVPGITFVVDLGLARISRYSVRTKVQRLPIEPISKASANQRAGRCGRVSNGICIRLYSQEDFDSRPDFTDPEIQRTNLAAVILQMLQLGVGDVRRFPFVDPPDNKQINDGFQLLEDLQAINQHNKLTALGKQMAGLPIDPQMARMIIEAGRRQCLREVLIITSALTVQDPRERPAEKQQAADEKHRRFWQEKSDFLAFVELWRYVEEQRQELSQNQWRKQSAKEFLSFMRLREWRDLHHQLRVAIKPLGLKDNNDVASYDDVHQSLLSGLVANIGVRDDEQKDYSYQGTRNRKFSIFPGSSLFKKRPKWLMAAEMLETSKLYAHCVAQIDPLWAASAAKHRVKHHYFEPHYSTKTGHVMAYDRVTLFGLTLEEKKRVTYSNIDPKISREVFIRSALVEGAYEKSRHQSKAAFYSQNQRTIEEVAELEAKSRRKDILVDEEVIYRFYDERLPATITHFAPFEHWRKEEEKQNPDILCLPKSLLMQHSASDITEAQFPNVLTIDGMDLALTYHFEPGHKDDGVTINVPISVLHHLQASRLEWLVPGMLREKCISLVKSLPKQWRKRLVPVPHYVDQMLARLKPSHTPLLEALTQQINIILGTSLPDDVWQGVTIDPYYLMNIRVIDYKQKEIATSRDLLNLREAYKDRVQKTLAKVGADKERDQIDTWDFGRLEESLSMQRSGIKVKAYPALVAEEKNISLRLLDNPQDAKIQSEIGVAQLIAKQVSGSVKYLKKEFLKNKDMTLSVVQLGSKADVLNDLVLAVVCDICSLHSELPRDKAAFDRLVALANSQLIPVSMEYEKILFDILSSIVMINKNMKNNKNALVLMHAFSDIKSQLANLVYPGFLYATPRQWLTEFPRFLQAVVNRLDKAAQSPQKDKVNSKTVQKHWLNHEQRFEKEGAVAYKSNEQWQKYRWMIEELRVSLFAQTLKTSLPVSDKRLEKVWEESLRK